VQFESGRFAEIALEFGNENWNPIFRPAAIPDPRTYAAVADRAFRLIREGAGPKPRFRMIVGGQYANPAVGASVLAHASAADTLAIAPYFLYGLSAGLPADRRLAALFDDSEADLTAAARDTSALGRGLAVYEVNLHTIAGGAPDSERNPLVAGAGAGGALGWRLIGALNAGAAIQCAYALAGFDASTAARGGFVRLWGVARDLAGAPRLRPTGLAIAMLNRAIGGDFYPVRSAGAEVTAAAFLSTSRWSAAIASAADRPLAVRIEFPAQPAAPLPRRMLRLASQSPFSTNEERQEARIAASAVPSAGRSITFSLAPYGLAVLLPEDNRE
jgi:hypothetical protein